MILSRSLARATARVGASAVRQGFSRPRFCSVRAMASAEEQAAKANAQWVHTREGRAVPRQGGRRTLQ